MTEERRAELLGHIAQSAGLAGSYVEGMRKEDFLADTRTQQAVIMNLVIIGEAAAKLMQDHPGFVQGHPEVPWNRRKACATASPTATLKLIWASCGIRFMQICLTC